MKIFLTSLLFAPSIGGIETVSMLLAREFIAAGHQVRVATITPDPAGSDFGFEVVREPAFPQLHERAKWCDIYYQNNISLPLAKPLLFVRRPWVVTHQTWIPVPWGLAGINHRMKRLLLPFTHGISISRAVAESMPVPSVVIPNPYETSLFYVRENIARTGDIVAFGRLVSDKGFDFLIEAMARLAGEGLRPKLSIIGDGPEREPLQRQVKELGLAAQVSFLGALQGTALAEELNRYRIAVVPSRWKEPFGIVALEAIACGCMVVGSRDGGLSDAIGPCGITFPNADVPALAEALSGLLKNPALLLKYREHAQEHLRRHHPAAVAGQYLKIFESLLKANHGI
jgi:glycosyltransferase involved in cell wall biosynthesis